MDIPAITMDRGAARAAFLQYRHAVKARHSAEDEAIMRGYRALSQGRQILSLFDTIRAGGLDELHRPKLAVARADKSRVFVRAERRGHVRFGYTSWLKSQEAGKVYLADCLPWTSWRDQEWTATASAIVPNIPPALRPVAKLSGYFVLFEADWKHAPADPALLKPLGGGLYVVLATWNLTELERAVLGMTRRA